MEGLILTVERKEFDTNLDLIGKPIYYKGNGVLGNEMVPLEQYLLITDVTKTTIGVVDHRKRGIVLDISQVNSATTFAVVADYTLHEDVVAPPAEPEVVAPDTEPTP